MIRTFSLFLTICLLTVMATGFAQTNLLRNGSFEGGTRYWCDTDGLRIAKGDAANGDSALCITDGRYISSAAFELKAAKPVTISFSVRADANTTMGLQCSPCSREIGVRMQQTWGLRATHPYQATRDWKRYTWTFTPNAPNDGFWPRQTYLIQIGDANPKVPIYVDGVCVSYATDSIFHSYAPVEVQINSPDLKGYIADGNLLKHGQSVRLVGSVFNPSHTARVLRLRWQLMDYEGTLPRSKPIEKTVTVAAAKTLRQTITLPLEPNGMVLARFQAWDGKTRLDSSDLPLCSLPYPKAATQPDATERFGGSFFGAHVWEWGRKIGFAWARWTTPTQWDAHQPDNASQ